VEYMDLGQLNVK